MKEDNVKTILWVIIVIAIIVLAIIIINQQHKPSSILNEDTSYILILSVGVKNPRGKS